MIPISNYFYTMFYLYLKETIRFLKVYNQTIIAPVINAVLFLVVLKIIFQNRMSVSTTGSLSEVNLTQFLGSGLIMMSVIQNAFANTAHTFVMSKVVGSIVDYLIPPFTSMQIIISGVFAAATRGVLLALFCALVIEILYPDFAIKHFWLFIAWNIFSSIIVAFFGLIVGIIADNFDKMSALTSYVISPLSFLSGTFYSIHQLSPFWQKLAAINPFFYMIDGLRYSVCGYSEIGLKKGFVFLSIITVILFLITKRMLDTGYKLKK